MSAISISIKTESRLIDALREAVQKEPTRAEIEKQRVSYVYGFMGHTSTMTRAEVERLVEKQEGR